MSRGAASSDESMGGHGGPPAPDVSEPITDDDIPF
jgi:hypothetical protein